MAAPTFFDGIYRAVKELALPSVMLLAIVGVIRVVYGGRVAGIAYILLTSLILGGIYTAAKYWNIRYTMGFVITGLTVWIVIPGVIPQFIPSLFADLGTVAGFVFLLAIALILTDKW